MFALHREKRITGNFRTRDGVMQCEVVIVIFRPSGALDCYKTWRTALDSDYELARVMAHRALQREVA